MTSTPLDREVRSLRHGFARAARGAAAGALLLWSWPTLAFDFTNSSGTFTGSWDTTLTYGTAWRIQDTDCNLIAIADGGCGRSPNIDDGNLNFGTGSYTRAFKVLSELGLNYGNFGVFVRGSALYDDYIESTPTERTPLTEDAQDLVGSYVRLLDAFAYYKFDLGSLPGEIRAGSQVVSWGESTFIQGGINAINHFDVSALRVPGSELKEGFMPQEMVFLSLGITENTSIEALYLFDWDDTEPEPVGSYFSTNDFVPDGGNKVILGFGGFSDMGVDFRPLGPGTPFITNFQAVPRGFTIEPEEEGQFGVALRHFFPDFNNGTEFGLFYINYHSRVPLISGRTGTSTGVGNAAGAVTAVGGAAQGMAAGLPFAAAVATAANAAVARAAATGGNMTLATATGYASIGANLAVAGTSPADISRNASNIATHEFAQTAQYFTEFPEDIHLIGLSFNTQFQRTGIALAGRSLLSAGRAAAVRRRGSAVRGADTARSGALSHQRAWSAVSDGLRKLARHHDAGALRAARSVRRQRSGAGLDSARHLPGTVHRHQDRLEHPGRCADGVRLRSGRHLHRRARRQAYWRSEQPRPALQRSRHIGERQPGAGRPPLSATPGRPVPGAEPGRAAEPFRGSDFLGISRRGPPRVSEPHGALDRYAALSLVA